MIGILFRSKLRMLKNQITKASIFELGGYVCIISMAFLMCFMVAKAFIFADPEFLFSWVSSAGIPLLNSVSIFLIHLFFMASLGATLTDTTAVLWSAEATYLLRFPFSHIKFFLFQLISTAIQMLPTFTLLTPLALVYLYFFYRTLSLPLFITFIVVIAVLITLLMFFLSSIIIFIACLKAKLLSYFKQRTLFIITLMIFAKILWSIFYPAYNGFVSDSSLAAGVMRVINNQGGFSGIIGKYSPSSQLIKMISFFSDFNYILLMERFIYSLFVIFLTMAATIFLLKLFFFDDLGLLVENAHLKQCTTTSMKYIFPLNKMPSLIRGIIYDDFIHFMRFGSLGFLLIAVPIIFSVVALDTSLAFLPSLMSKMIRDLYTGKGVFLYCSNISLLYLILSDGFKSELSAKSDFFPLMRCLPVRLKSILFIKCFTNGVCLFALNLICLGCWMHVMDFSIREVCLAFFLAGFIGFLGPFFGMGIDVLVIALLSDSQKVSGSHPVLIFSSLLSIALMFGSILYPLQEGKIYILPLVFIFWAIAVTKIFSHGIRLMENKDLVC